MPEVKEQPSSGSKGANKTDLPKDEEVRFTTDQIENIEYLAETMSGHAEKFLMKFPEGSVIVCERRQRPLASTIACLRDIHREYRREEVQDLLLEILSTLLHESWTIETRELSIDEDTWTFWRMLYRTMEHLYTEPIPVSDIRTTELVPIVCLQ